MRIEVTQDDIMGGCPGHPTGCPVALAVRRATGAERVAVDPYDIDIDMGLDGLITYRTPLEVAQFIKTFDGGRKPKPITFEMDEERT